MRMISARVSVTSVLLLFLACGHEPDWKQITFMGTVKARERFQYPFGGRFIFALKSSEFGWFLTISENGRDEDLARLTPPFHFVPNPRDIEGWHFRNEENTGPNDGSVNAPQKERYFIFSPEVGRSIDGPAAHSEVTTEDIDRISSFGRGDLTINRMILSPSSSSASMFLSKPANCGNNIKFRNFCIACPVRGRSFVVLLK